MASKADMLKKGAKKTGHGLFSGMEKLNARETEAVAENNATDDIEKLSKLTEKPNKKEVPSIDDKKKETVIEEKTEVAVKEEPTVHTEDDSLSRRPVDEAAELAGTERSGVLDEILKDVSSANKEDNNKSDIREESMPGSENNQMSTLIQTAQSEDKKADDNDVKERINNAKTPDEKPAKKQNSRYEKDKFLLLDIRGYRDYIEHIAKAANMSATKYIRSLIEQDMEKNKEIYLAHKKLEEMLRGKSGT